MTHDEIREDLSLLALGSMDPSDRREIEDHLTAGCVDCEEELATWGEVVGVLAAETGPSPASGLKAVLLQRAAPTGEVAREIPREPRSLELSSFQRWGWLPMALAAGVIFMVAERREQILEAKIDAQTTRIGAIEREREEARKELFTAAAQLQAQEKDVASLRASLESAERDLSLLQARGVQLVRLDRTKPEQSGEAHVLYSEKAGRALFYGFDLPALPDDRTFEFWWITEEEGPINAGLFVSASDGTGRIEATLPSNSGRIASVAVTIEPAGGVPKPTGPMVLLGNLT